MSQATSGEQTHRRLTPWILGVGAVTFLAGLLFGYDQGVISGALPLVTADLDLSTFESEIVTSWVTLGALFGALAAGGTADRIGRRWTAVVAGVLFAIGALIEAGAPDATLLTIGRLVTGLGVGFASVVAPLYAAEMSPARLRGRFVSTYQLAITFGILLAYLADDVLTRSDRWRLMFGLAVIPGALLVDRLPRDARVRTLAAEDGAPRRRARLAREDRRSGGGGRRARDHRGGPRAGGCRG